MNTSSLHDFLDLYDELVIVDHSGNLVNANSNEIEIEETKSKSLIGFPFMKGWKTLRISSFEISGPQAKLFLSNHLSGEKDVFTFTARTEYSELKADLDEARFQTANRIARSIIEADRNLKLIRVELAKENSRLAIVTIKTTKQMIACIVDLVENLSPEFLITSAILLLQKLQNRKKNPIGLIRIYRKNAKPLQLLLACLTVKNIEVFELKTINAKPLKRLRLSDLWKRRSGKFTFNSMVKRSSISRSIAKEIEIDHLFSANGETVRYLGLPFVRIRESMGNERAWFGTGKRRKLLNDDSIEEFGKLIEDLKIYRSPRSPNIQHSFYADAPEAWLESILRSDIKALDSNLFLSPIYNQFRTSRDKIDLLALRNDGRLIIIELKVSPDREMLFQALDYWRKIEHQRRKGILAKADLFAGKKIANKSAMIYLVAPALCFQRQTNFFSNTIDPTIDIYKFEIATNWREKIIVIDRNVLGGIN